MKKCVECNCELEDYEDDLCEECKNNLAASVIHTDGIWPDEEDFI